MTSLRVNSESFKTETKMLGDALSHWLERTEWTSIVKTCLTCRHLSADDRTCQKFNAQPPVSVVVKGCEQYADNEDIPF